MTALAVVGILIVLILSALFGGAFVLLTNEVDDDAHEDGDEPDICGLCGQPGADKYAHPHHWPGEQIYNGPLVHQACEDEECQRAHALLTDKQRKDFLRWV